MIPSKLRKTQFISCTLTTLTTIREIMKAIFKLAGVIALPVVLSGCAAVGSVAVQLAAEAVGSYDSTSPWVETKHGDTLAVIQKYNGRSDKSAIDEFGFTCKTYRDKPVDASNVELSLHWSVNAHPVDSISGYESKSFKDKEAVNEIYKLASAGNDIELDIYRATFTFKGETNSEVLKSFVQNCIEVSQNLYSTEQVRIKDAQKRREERSLERFADIEKRMAKAGISGGNIRTYNRLESAVGDIKDGTTKAGDTIWFLHHSNYTVAQQIGGGYLVTSKYNNLSFLVYSDRQAFEGDAITDISNILHYKGVTSYTTVIGGTKQAVIFKAL